MIKRTTWLKTVDALAGAAACLLLGFFHFLRHGNRLSPDAARDAVRRILVIRPGGLGDMILLLPALRALREGLPGAAVDVVCEKRNAELLRAIGFEGHVLLYDRAPLQFLTRLRAQPYDLAIDTEQFHNFSAVFAYLSGAPVRIGFKINPRRNALYTHLTNYDLDGPEARQFLRLLAPLGLDRANGGEEGALRDFPTRPPPTGLALPETDRFVALHAGGSAAFKHWPPQRFAELARQLRSEHALTTVLVGGRGDRAISEAVLAAAGPDAGLVSFAGRLDLSQTAFVLQHARLFVGVDSGLAHLAVALGTPSVTIFGPSDPRKWGLENARHAVVRRPLPCSPCCIFGYHRPCRHTACLGSLTLADVTDACGRILHHIREAPEPPLNTSGARVA